ncbi:MAG TPA: hypothetical protein VHZ56_05015, partial [Devosia sp.]|nr:hypothetical protein [Devosia sp.]
LAPAAPLPPADEAARVAATDAAFATIAYATTGLAIVSAIVAWFTLERRPGTPATQATATRDGL